MSTDIDYHLGRARIERDIAYRSANPNASDVHMRLSALHLSRALLLQEVRRWPDSNVRLLQPSSFGRPAPGKSAMPALSVEPGGGRPSAPVHDLPVRTDRISGMGR